MSQGKRIKVKGKRVVALLKKGILPFTFFLLPLTLPLVAAMAATTWTLQPTANGFQWVSPSGPPVCKFIAASTIDPSQIVRTGQFPTLYPDKYPDKPTWLAKKQERLIQRGFNACAYTTNTDVNRAAK